MMYCNGQFPYHVQDHRTKGSYDVTIGTVRLISIGLLLNSTIKWTKVMEMLILLFNTKKFNADQRSRPKGVARSFYQLF